MSRYGLFGATDANNKYVKFMSDGLSQFIESSGATNFGFTVDEITRTATGFTPLPGYVEQPGNEKPVTVRYIPMHLYKRGGAFASMKPIYVLSVNGDEDSRRAARYHWTVMMDREDLLNPPKGTYLDRIFGIPLMTSRQIKGIREGTTKTDWALTPQNVPTALTKKSEDRRAVYGAVDALYREKYVFIKLESGQTFRHRAFEILGEIYSMLQPEFAVEVGFASYQALDGIDSLISDAGVRIFVFPHEIDETKLHRDDAVLIDLDHTENIAKPENEELLRCLEKWAGLEWEDRCDAMQKLFARPGIDFKSAETFVRISSEFFDNDFIQWQKLGRNVPQAGKITSLAELKDLYDSFDILKTYETKYNKAQFQKMLKYLLPKGANLNGWVRDALAEVGYAEFEPKMAKTLAQQGHEDVSNAVFGECRSDFTEGNIEIRQKIALAEFGKQFISDDVLGRLAGAVPSKVIELIKKTVEETVKRLNEKHQKQIEEINANHQKEIEEINAKHQSEIEEINAKHQSAIEEVNAKHQKEIEEINEKHQKEIERINANCKKEIEEIKTRYKEQLDAKNKELDQQKKDNEELKKDNEELKKKHETEKKSLQSQHKQELQAEKKKYDEQRKAQAAEIEKLKKGSGQKDTSTAKILFGVIGLAVGAAVCFGVFAMLGKLKTPEPEIVYVTPAPTVEPTATPEATPLPTAEPTPTPAALLTEDGQVNEEYAAENAPDIQVVTDTAQIEQLYALPSGYEYIALFTSKNIEGESAAEAETSAETEEAAETSEASPAEITDYAVLLRRADTEETEESAETPAGPYTVIDNGEYRMVIFGGTEFQETIRKLYDSLLAENECPQIIIILADGNTIDLTELLNEYFAQEGSSGSWYQELRHITTAEEDLSTLASASDTEPIVAAAVFDDGEVKICGTAGIYHAASETPAESSGPAESETDNA